MVRGIDSFKEWFVDFEDCYTIIGGTACDLLMGNEGMDFRATKDLDIVLIVEKIDTSFARKFWEYIEVAGYEHKNKSTGNPQFYRFTNPRSKDFPAMIELFTRKQSFIYLPEDAKLSPLPISEDLSSLSAILLNDDYYAFMLNGKRNISGVTVLDVPFLISFKAKAWLDLTEKNDSTVHVDSRDIRKHKNDVFRLSELLEEDQKPLSFLPEEIKNDMRKFIEEMRLEEVDLKQLGIRGRTKEDILDQLSIIYDCKKSL